MTNSIKVAPSILSCDFAYLANEIKKIEKAKADAIHIDVMDGHFVHNLTVGPDIVKAIRKNTKLLLDVHLMIYNPFDYIEEFIKAGADLITFHFEATEDIEDTIKFIKTCNRKVGLAFNPATSFSLGEKYLLDIDLLLFMSVHPGFGGQKFISKVLEKIKRAKELKDENSFKYDIQVDGGIDDKTSKECIKNGANFLVSGSYLFSLKDMQKGVEILKRL